MDDEQRQRQRAAMAADAAYRAGDGVALRAVLGDPPDFPDNRQPMELGCGTYPLGHAIFWSPIAFIAELLAQGADPNYPADDGFPSLLAALSSDRADRSRILTMLLAAGADPAQRGLNDWTPLHYAVARQDITSVRLLLDHGADPLARTNIDDYSTPVEDAEAQGWSDAAGLLRQAAAKRAK